MPGALQTGVAWTQQQGSPERTGIPEDNSQWSALFTDSAIFPGDKPPNMLQLKDLRKSGTRRPGTKDIPGELRAAWAQIMQATNQ
jgi:hypothetical protein